MSAAFPSTRHPNAGLSAALCALALAATLSSAVEPDLFDETTGTTLFAFDAVSIPHTENLRLEMRSPKKHAANPILSRGEPGTPDAQGVQFYGSVIREGGKFRLWYVAYDDDSTNRVASARWRPAYAESSDGLHWLKPDLGLVEYAGTRKNNLVLTDPAPLGMINLKVLADPDDPDPKRRYKISTHVYFRDQRRLGTLAPFASADGLHWKMLTAATPKNAELRKDEVVLPPIHFEPCGGLYRWDGLFYISGQNALTLSRPYHGRVAQVYHSPDFVHWAPTSAVSFVRPAQHTLLGAGRSLEGEQTHEGISVWNRRNLLLGVVGLWHGAREWQDVTIDLGFVVSNDGISFREPEHEWTFLRRGEDGAWDEGGLLQGQGFENVGKETLIYYGAWDPRRTKESQPRGGVGLATLPRDRFAALVVEKANEGPGDYQQPVTESSFITAAIPATGPTRFYLNADGLGADAALQIDLLDEHEQPLPGCSGQDAAVVRQSGFQTPITWNGNAELRDLPARVRLRASFVGPRKTDIHFHALYLRSVR